MAASAIHPRARWVAGALPVEPGDRVLEVGCGRGDAARLVAAQAVASHVTAIDRSARAVTQAADRGASLVHAGRLSLLHASLADLADAPDHRGGYDVVFAVNVNLFWSEPRRDEAAVVRSALGEAGSCVLFYDVPCPALAARTSRGARRAMHELGFVTEPVAGPTPTHVAIRATLETSITAAAD